MHDFTAVVQNFAADADLLQTGQTQEIERRFCMSISPQYAAFDANEGEEMARAGKARRRSFI